MSIVQADPDVLRALERICERLDRLEASTVVRRPPLTFPDFKILSVLLPRLKKRLGGFGCVFTAKQVADDPHLQPLVDGLNTTEIGLMFYRAENQNCCDGITVRSVSRDHNRRLWMLIAFEDE